MFLRKLTVMVVPLLLCLALCLLVPSMSGWGFFSWVVCGMLLGIVLSLVLPLSGAVRRRETFGGWLWVPTLVLMAVVLLQYLHSVGTVDFPLLATSQPMVILVECAFAGFMATTCLRTLEH